MKDPTLPQIVWSVVVLLPGMRQLRVTATAETPEQAQAAVLDAVAHLPGSRVGTAYPVEVLPDV